MARPWSCLRCHRLLGTIGRDRDETDALNLSDLPPRVEWRSDHVLVTCRCGEVRAWRRGRVLLQAQPCGSINANELDG